MSEHIVKTIADFRQKLERAESEVIRLKKTINDLCEMGDMPPIFDAAALEPASSSAATTNFSTDAFYGKPLATCVKLILDKRKAAGLGAAATGEIFKLLETHGYNFEGKEENRMTILRTILRKNPDFHRLPNNTVGLTAWYPRIKQKTNGGEVEEEEADLALEAEDSAEEPPGKKPATKEA